VSNYSRWLRCLLVVGYTQPHQPKDFSIRPARLDIERPSRELARAMDDSWPFVGRLYCTCKYLRLIGDVP